MTVSIPSSSKTRCAFDKIAPAGSGYYSKCGTTTVGATIARSSYRRGVSKIRSEITSASSRVAQCRIPRPIQHVTGLASRILRLIMIVRPQWIRGSILIFERQYEPDSSGVDWNEPLDTIRHKHGRARCGRRLLQVDSSTAPIPISHELLSD